MWILFRNVVMVEAKAKKMVMTTNRREAERVCIIQIICHLTNRARPQRLRRSRWTHEQTNLCVAVQFVLDVLTLNDECSQFSSQFE